MNECNGRCELCGKGSMRDCGKCGGMSPQLNYFLRALLGSARNEYIPIQKRPGNRRSRIKRQATR